MTPNGFPKSRPALILAIAVPLGVLGDALWVRSDPDGPPWQALDDRWNGLVGGPDDGLMWSLAELLYHVGAQAGLVVLAVAAIGLLFVRRWRSAVFACAAVAATAIAVDLLKTVGERPRPADIMVETSSWAFPSGHAARMAAFAVVIAVVAIPARHLRFWWPIGAALTFATGSTPTG
jgi:undecaprenyl-diphosphatase